MYLVNGFKYYVIDMLIDGYQRLKHVENETETKLKITSYSLSFRTVTLPPDSIVRDYFFTTVIIIIIIIISNSIKEEIKERIALGIKAYYANQKFFKSRLVTKYSNLKLHRMVIRTIVIYASETRVL